VKTVFILITVIIFFSIANGVFTLWQWYYNKPQQTRREYSRTIDRWQFAEAMSRIFAN
jgi:hypothetical protein